MSHLSDEQGGPRDGHRDLSPVNHMSVDRRTAIIVAVLLAIPIVALMWVPSYAREDPAIGGVPFFFWYQFVWVFITAGLTWTAYVLLERSRTSRTARRVDGAAQ